MALVWSKQSGDQLYEVRRAGQTLRLYTNGVFHSQWHPNRILNGHLWDLLILPAFLIPTNKLDKILVLGVGGGAAIRSMNSLFNIKKIVGIDLDPIHLNIARRFFNCKSDNIDLIHAEASQFVKKDKRKFNYIIEDIFIENPKLKGDAIRALPATLEWFKQLQAKLSKTGILVSNFESRRQLENFLQLGIKRKLRFQQILCFESPRYENAIAIFSNSKIKLDDLQSKLADSLGGKASEKIMSEFIFEKI